jgi:hypothetical protein
MQPRRFIALAVLVWAAAGCGGGELVSVKGKITLKGVPLESASIHFIPTGATKGEGGMARSDKDGNYTLIDSRSHQKGIAPGEYKIWVSRWVLADGSLIGPDTPLSAGGGNLIEVKESLPRPYSSRADTPLHYTVPTAGGVVDIDIPADFVLLDVGTSLKDAGR